MIPIREEYILYRDIIPFMLKYSVFRPGIQWAKAVFCILTQFINDLAYSNLDVRRYIL